MQSCTPTIFRILSIVDRHRQTRSRSRDFPPLCVDDDDDDVMEKMTYVHLLCLLAIFVTPTTKKESKELTLY
jgi:hypothetical protein